MAKKLYFEEEDAELCYTKESIIERGEPGAKEVEVFTAVPDKPGGGIFWCRTDGCTGDDSKDTCGKQCPNYEPRNGKSGCCKSYTTTMYVPGEEVTIKIK